MAKATERTFHIARKSGGYMGDHLILACGTNRVEVVKAAVKRWNAEWPDPSLPATSEMVQVETVRIQPLFTPGWNGDPDEITYGKKRSSSW